MSDQVDFAIITSREDEFVAVLDRFPQTPQSGSSGRTYGISHVKTRTGQDCAVALVRCVEEGADTAQQVANDIIRDWDPQMILVVGIASGVPSHGFTLGDVVISTRIHNLNVSKRFGDGYEEFDIRGGIHPGVSDIAASLLLYREAFAGWNELTSIPLERPKVDLQQFETNEFQAKLVDEHKHASWYKKLYESITTQLGGTKNSTRHPYFTTRTIASSNSEIDTVDLPVQWLQTANSIRAVDIGTAGVYQAAQQIRKQGLVMAIRGISNIIGFESGNQWTEYACQMAAAFAYAFITADIVPLRGTSTIWQRDNISLPPSSPSHIAIMYVSASTSDTLSIVGWNRHRDLPMHTIDRKQVDPVNRLVKGESPEQIVKIIRHQLRKMSKEVQLWVSDLLEVYQDRLCIAIIQDKNLDIPWEMLPLDRDNYLGGRVGVTRWRKTLDRILRLEEREFTGTLLVYLDESEADIKPERTVVKALQRKEYEQLEDLRELLESDDSLESLGLIYLRCEGHSGTVIHSRFNPTQKIRAYQLEGSERPGRRPVVFLHANTSAQIDTGDDPGLLEVSLDYFADGYIGLRGDVDQISASRIGTHFLKLAGMQSGGIHIAGELRYLRAEATKKIISSREEQDFLDFLHTFMYVYYGSPLDKLMLIPEQDEEQ